MKQILAAEFVKKIKVKSILGDEFEPSQIEEEEVLYVAMGTVEKVVCEESFFGPYLSMHGNLECFRTDDGGSIVGEVIILPEPVGKVIATLCAEELVKLKGFMGAGANALTGQNAAVKFGIAIGIRPIAGVVGYEWFFHTLVPVSPVDALEDLRDKVWKELKKA